MGIIINGTTGIDLGHTPISNGTNVEVEGNLNISGSGSRITGDFSNSIFQNRVAFQSSVTNDPTTLTILPNGSGQLSQIQAYSSSAANNCSRLNTGVNTATGYVHISSDIVGSGTYLPMLFSVGGSERMRIGVDGNISITGNIGSGSQSFNGFGGSGIKNRIINGGMDIWQRGVNFSLPNNETWTADRWKIGVAGAPVAQVYKGGQVFGYGLNTLAIDGSAGNTIFQLRHYIESLNCRDFTAGQKITVSFDVFTNAGFVAKDLGVIIERPISADQWPVSYDGIAQNVSLPSGVSSSKKSVTFTLPNSYFQWGLKLLFNLGTGLKAGETIAFGNVQLEVGSIATPFEQRPYGLELSLCQRYYQKISWSDRKTATANGQCLHVSVALPIQMRVLPTIVNISQGTKNNATYIGASALSERHIRCEAISPLAGDSYILNAVEQLSAEL